MPDGKIKEFLESNHVTYVSFGHPQAFTAQEVATSARIQEKELAKTVMVKIDGKMAMAVLPASHRVDFHLLKGICGAKKIELAREAEFKDLFGECEIGAMPPLGMLYGMDVFASESLEKNTMIVFNAGSHTELIRLKYNDFKRLVEPKIGRFSQEAVSLSILVA
jgi:Ala-tRNA(Pro) deacylase